MKNIILIIAIVVAFTGCKDVVKPKVEEVVRDYGLEDKVTTVCYDYFDKTPCPKGTLQIDIDILSFVPSNSRFCFGFTDANITIDGKKCYNRDIIK